MKIYFLGQPWTKLWRQIQKIKYHRLFYRTSYSCIFAILLQFFKICFWDDRPSNFIWVPSALDNSSKKFLEISKFRNILRHKLFDNSWDIFCHNCLKIFLLDVSSPKMHRTSKTVRFFEEYTRKYCLNTALL